MGGDATTTRRRRRSASPPAPAPAAPLEDESILEQILLRLPTRSGAASSQIPTSIQSWTLLTPSRRRGSLSGTTATPPPATTGSFSATARGRVIVFNRTRTRLELIVWDPVTGDRSRVAAPPGVDDVKMQICDGAVLCTLDDKGHMHGAECRMSPFQIILIWYSNDENEWYLCVHSSETGKWGNLSSAAIPQTGYLLTPGVLNHGGVGLAVLTDFRLDMRERKVGCNGAAIWVLQKTVNL